MTKQQELLILVGDDDNSLEEAFTAGNKYEVQSISKDQALSAIQSLSESERKRARLLVNDIENIGFLRLLKQNNLELPSVLLTTASMAKEVTDLSDEISHCVVVTKPCIGDGIVEALDDAVHRFKEAQAAAAIESLKAAEALKPLAIVADDNKGILFLLEMITKRSGYRVESFADGASALKEIQRLAAQGETPALLVTDNEMPEMSGIKLLQNLGHHGISMPTVFLSGNINDDVQRQVSKICPHVVIRQKPLNMAHEVFLEATKQFNEASFSPSEIVESQQRQGSSEQQQGSRPGR